jgi:hypothetical protein
MRSNTYTNKWLQRITSNTVIALNIVVGVFLLGCSNERTENVQLPNKGVVSITRHSGGDLSGCAFFNASNSLVLRVAIKTSGDTKEVIFLSPDGAVLDRTEIRAGAVSASSSGNIYFENKWDTTSAGTKVERVWKHRDGYVVFKEVVLKDRSGGSRTMHFGPFETVIDSQAQSPK